MTGTSTTAGAPVRLERLRKTYGPVVAVDGIDLDIQAGEFVTLLGPSGSGKTTTLMMIAGFQEATDGTIHVGDRDITDLQPNQRDIGVVFQHYALFPHMRVHDNVAFPLRMRKVAKGDIDRRVKDALSLVRLGGYERRYPRQLSGGQQQRVALARAVVFEPGLALMDEPLGALDRQLREEMQYEIKRLQNTLGITVVYVTHDQGEALVMSDRIAVMNHGRIEQYAAPEVLYDQPATAFVSTFVGESNVLRGTARSAGGQELELVTEHGLRASGRPSQSIPAGAEVVATLRPEKLVIDGQDGPDGVNMTMATCEEAIYAGDISRYVVRASGGDQLILRVQNRPGMVRMARGSTLHLAWAVDDLRVFPADRSEAWTAPEDEGAAAPDDPDRSAG
jgi:putative spermidine/putrescine transport system ATP-binding protein